MLIRLGLILLVAVAICSTCCDGKKNKQKKARKLEKQKLARYEKWQAKHAVKMKNDGAEVLSQLDDEEDPIFDNTKDMDISTEEVEEELLIDEEEDEENVQHTVVKRDVHSGAEYRHTVLSRRGSPLHITLVEKVDRRMKRATSDQPNKWPHKIPYIIDPSYSNLQWRVQLFKRAVKFIMDNVCLTFIDETDNRDASNSKWFTENGYDFDAYMLVKSGGGCSAVFGTGGPGSRPRVLYPCEDFGINVHEILHTLGGSHAQQGVNRDNYITINRDNVLSNLQVTYNIMSRDPVMEDYFDPESFLMYTAGTWSSNGLSTYEWIREDISRSYNGYSQEAVNFYELNQIYQCNVFACNDDTTDCGVGYFAQVKGVCRCVCPSELDPNTNCQSAINSASPANLASWPKTPMVVWAAGPNYECPDGFDQTPGWYSFSGTWGSREDTTIPIRWPRTGIKTDYGVCTRNVPTNPSEVDWDSWPNGGRFCMFQAQGTECEYPFGNYTLTVESRETINTNGSLGASSVNGKNLTLKLCCKGTEISKFPIEMPNNKPFRLWAKGTCPRIKGMRDYKGVMAFFSTTKSGYGSVGPQYYTWSHELQFYQCYYQPAVYGCNQKITLNRGTPSVTVTTPGFDTAREPDRRCFYTFDVPENASIRITFNTYDVDSNDLLLVKRYHEWQAAYRIENANHPYQFVSERDYLSMEYFAGYKTVSNKGINFTADVILPEELCYDASKNGADYTGDTSISETYEKCLPWIDTMDCTDFPFNAIDAVLLLSSSNKCRNPDGLLRQPWCYTHKNGTNCQKRYCDVCNLKKPVDVIRTCADLMAEDPDFCNSGLQRYGCFKSCNFVQSPNNILDCPDGWTPYKDRCYKYISLPYQNRPDAENTCRAAGPTGTLFQIRSLEDQQLVRNLKAANGPSDHHGHWVSGELDPVTGQWLYTDTNVPMTYFNWSSTADTNNPDENCILMLDTNNPNENCIKMIAEYQRKNQQGAWKGKKCDDTRHRAQSMCQINRKVTCTQPTIPSDGTLVSAPKTFYSEGDKAIIKCNTYNTDPSDNEIMCTSSGWTSLAYACSECPKGWVPYGSRCFYHSPGWTNMPAAADICRSFGPSSTLFQMTDSTDDQVIRSYRQAMGSAYHHGLWISGYRDHTTGEWLYTDTNTTMTYTNWASSAVTNSNSLDCIKVIAEYASSEQGKWKTKSCSDANHNAQYVCQVDRLPQGCLDKITTCEQSMTEYPQFCKNSGWMDVAEQYCYKSCGGCPDQNTCQEHTSSTYHRTSASGSIEPGDVMTFECNAGLYYVAGDLERACSSSGSLLGKDLVCQANPVATNINLNSITKKRGTFPSKTAFLLDKDGYRIPFDGKITKWYYFCQSPKPIDLIVYRPDAAGGYSFVGSNSITCVAGWAWSYNVPDSEQIVVQQGDVFGMYTKQWGSVYAENCNTRVDKLLNMPSTTASSLEDLKTKNFDSIKCLIPSLGIHVEP